MTHLRVRRVLNTGAALMALALALVTACASPHPGTAAAIFRPGSPSTRGAVDGRARAPRGGENGGIRRPGAALDHGVFLEHLESCARQYPVIRQAPPKRALAVGLHESGLHPLAIHDNTTG